MRWLVAISFVGSIAVLGCSSSGGGSGFVDNDASTASDASGDSTTPDSGPSCQPTTCEAASISCGQLPDGCGGILECGTCAEGLFCGGDGPGQCGDTPCVPTTCADAGAQCGPATDGCGAILECGSCTAPDTCQAGQCSCVPKTCESSNAQCGAMPDGCGGTLDCGGCPSGQSCGGNGPNQCGDGECIPSTCEAAGAACGELADGCGTLLDCGGCAENEVCGNNQCQCVPTSCEALSVACGPADDGCGGTLDCGACPLCASGCPNGFECVEGDICDGGDLQDLVLDVRSYTASVSLKSNGAVATALPACYDGTYSDWTIWRVTFTEKERGYTISRTGNCEDLVAFQVKLFPGTYEVRAGGTPDQTNLPGFDQVIIDALEVNADVPNLVLDVKSHTVHASMKSNGAAAQALPTCYDGTYSDWTIWQVQFIEKERGYTLSRTGNCDDLAAFELKLFPGTYEVRAGGTPDQTNLPGFDQVIIDALEVSADVPNLVLDVKSHAVHGSMKSNGAIAQALPTCYDGTYSDWTIWRVEFIEKERGYTLSQTGNCDDLVAFDLKLFPGTYEVRAGGTPDQTNLPGFDQVIIDALEVNADIPNLVLDVKSHTVHASMTTNGAVAQALPACYDGTYSDWTIWQVEFTEKARGYTLTRTGNCDDLLAFDIELFPGTYEVRAGGTPDQTNLPGFDQVLIDALEVNADIPNLVLDVKSHVVHVSMKSNGAVAKALPACYDGTYSDWTIWQVKFTEKARGYTLTKTGNCDDLLAFDIELFPGTYEVRAGGTPDQTNFPGFDQVIIDALEVSADIPNLVLDVLSIPVHVSLLSNGVAAAPLLQCYDGTYSDWTIWRVQFTEPERGYTLTKTGNCDDLMPFDIDLFPGVYEVRAGGTPDQTNLPGFDQVIIDKLAVP